MSARVIDLNRRPETDGNPFFRDSDVLNPFFSEGFTVPSDVGFEFEFCIQPDEEEDDDFHGLVNGGEGDWSNGAVRHTYESSNVATDSFESNGHHVDGGNLIWESDGVEDDLGIEVRFDSGVGPRVLDLNSEPDSEEFEVNSASINYNSNSSDANDYWDTPNTIDFLGVGGDSINNHERGDFEGEEVSERLHLDEGEAIDGNEELSVPFDFMNIDSDENNSSLWEELDEDEDENPYSGNPPAAKHVVESLPTVVLKREDIAENGGGCVVVVCAICRNEALADEVLTKMPCSHSYHRDCIVHWLSIRNTCPVCRYELLTDDEDYEKRRSSRARVLS